MHLNLKYYAVTQSEHYFEIKSNINIPEYLIIRDVII